MSQTATAFRVGIIMAAEKIALVEAAAFADREHGPWPLTFHEGQKLDKARSMLEAWEVAVELWLGKSDTTRI